MTESQVVGIPVLRAVRAKCLECSAGSPKEVDLCPVTDCSLYPFRYGKNPFRAKREMSDKQREEVKERLTKARKAKKEERGLPE